MERNDKEGSAEPVLALLQRDQEWTTNQELADALGFVNRRGNKSVVGHWKEPIGETFHQSETKLAAPDGGQFGKRGDVRVFNKRGVVRAAMRARTANARAFQDWLIGRVAESEVWDG